MSDITLPKRRTPGETHIYWQGYLSALENVKKYIPAAHDGVIDFLIDIAKDLSGTHEESKS